MDSTQIAQMTTSLYSADQIFDAMQAEKAQPRPALKTTFIAPQTPTQQALAEIWRELLGITHVGIDDNFFEIGGHSLMATQFIARVQETFQIEVPLTVLFDGTPTIAHLAAAIEQYQIEQANPDEIASALRELEDLSDDEIKALLAREVQ